jgi:hypothetical protein
MYSGEGNRMYFYVPEDYLVIAENLSEVQVLYTDGCVTCSGIGFSGRRGDDTYIRGVAHIPSLVRKSSNREHIHYITEYVKSLGIFTIECAFTVSQEYEIEMICVALRAEGITVIRNSAMEFVRNHIGIRGAIFLTSQGIATLVYSGRHRNIILPPNICLWEEFSPGCLVGGLGRDEEQPPLGFSDAEMVTREEVTGEIIP